MYTTQARRASFRAVPSEARPGAVVRINNPSPLGQSAGSRSVPLRVAQDWGLPQYGVAFG